MMKDAQNSREAGKSLLVALKYKSISVTRL